MKYFVHSFALVFSLIISSFAMAQTAAPDFILPGDAGQVILSEQRGKVIYLDFWASWCPPCRESFPWMNAMQEKYGERGLKIIAVNLDKDRNDAKSFNAAANSLFTIVYDPEGATAEQYGVMGMPSSYLIDRDGQLQGTHIGFREKDKAKLEQKIIQLLDGK